MADVAPFRAIRYAHPGAEVTAPPYDVLTPEARDELRARDPHNVVHLTLNDSEDEAGRLFRAWVDEGVLVSDDEPAVWALPRSTSARTGSPDVATASWPRCGSSPTRPAPSCRTSARTRGRRRAACGCCARRGRNSSRSSSSTTASRPSACPTVSPTSSTEGTRLWRVPGEGVAEAFADRQLLIADGHHRYETAVAYAAEEGTPESARMMVVLVSTSDPGLEIFPTHRLFRGHEEALPPVSVGDSAAPAAAVARLAGLPYDRAQAVGYRKGVTFPVVGEPGELDVELVDRLVGHDGLGYTADLGEAVARVDSGEFDGAFLLRATRIEDVFERARRGEVMPQKTTYFFPKLTSGLLFHPV